MVVPKPVEEEKSSHKASISSQSLCSEQHHVSGFRFSSRLVRSVITASYCWKLCWQDCIKKVAKTTWLRPDHLDPRLEVLHLLRSVVQSFVIWNGCNLSGQGQNEEVA